MNYVYYTSLAAGILKLWQFLTLSCMLFWFVDDCPKRTSANKDAFKARCIPCLLWLRG
jgi:hypothetical protein